MEHYLTLFHLHMFSDIVLMPSLRACNVNSHYYE